MRDHLKEGVKNEESVLFCSNKFIGGGIMKKYYFVYFVAAMLLVSVASISHAGGWQSATKVYQFTIEGSSEGERIYVRFENNFNPDSCSTSLIEWTRVYGNTAQGKFIFASVLSAKAASQTVVPLLVGCDDWGRPILSGIWTQ